MRYSPRLRDYERSWCGSLRPFESDEVRFHGSVCGSRRREERDNMRKPYCRPLSHRKHPERACLRAGELLDNRYEILDCVGEGTTATVLEAWDHKTSSVVIIKVQKGSDYSYVMREIRILKTISKHCAHEDISVIRLLDWFESPDRRSIYLVFEKGLISLWDFMKTKPRFCLQDIRAFGEQLLSGISRVHALGIAHADFKPENVVFVPKGSVIGKEVREHIHYDSQGSAHPCKSVEGEGHECHDKELKIIDFGLAVFESSHHPRVVGTRAYSPPEIVLERPWGPALDIWGAACILVEMYIGTTLFSCKSDVEQLSMFESVLGPLPFSLIEQASSEKKEFFSPEGFVRWEEHIHDQRTVLKLNNQQPLLHYFHPDDLLFYDLITQMLRYMPEERITAEGALQHPFFTSWCECTCRRDNL